MFKRECSPYTEVVGVSLSWASQESFLDREVVGHVVTHVLYPDDFEAALVRPGDVIVS